MTRSTTALAALLLLVAAAPVAAQRGDSVALRLAEVEVVSILPAAGPAVGSGIPARTATVAGEEIDVWEPRLLADALAARAGFSLYDDLGSPFKTTLVTRGFTASPVVGLPQGVSVFLDGIPVNEPDARQVNFDLLPLEHVRWVELLSGTASLLGPNSLGGAVNLVTRRGGGGPEAEVEVSAGSFGAGSVEGAFSGGGRGWSWYGGSGWETERGWREETLARRADAFLNLGRHGADRGVGVQAFLARSYAETAGSLPESVYDARPRANLTAGDFEELAQLHLAASGHRPLGAGLGSFTLYLRAHDAERFNVNQENDPDVRSFSANRTLGASADWRAVRLAGAGTLGVRAGLSGAASRTDIRIHAERLDPGMTTHVRSPISEAGLFAAADWSRGRLALSAGLRADAVRIPFRNLLDGARDTTSLYLQASPRAGASVAVGGGAVLFASVGRSFRAPAVIELACADPENPCPLPFALGDDPPLDPVTAVTVEAGGRWSRGGAALAASAYRTEVRNDIFLFPYVDDEEPVGSTIDGFFANVEATRREGVEAEGRLAVRGGHAAYLNYAWTRATFQVDDVELFSIREEAGAGENEVERGDRLPLVPDHAVRAGVDVRLPRGAEAGFAARYTGRRWLRGDEANEEAPLPGYLVADARVGVRAGGWGLSAVVRNLFDARYAAFGTWNLHQAAGGVLERFLTPGEPRSVRLVLRREIGGNGR